MPINYREGKIFKIYNTITDDIYVGSTALKLCERVRDHRHCIKNETKKTRPLYKAFIEHGVGNFFIELIVKCPCNGKYELRKKEGAYIRELKPSLNIRIPGIHGQKEYIHEQKKQYYEINKERILQIQKEYKENNKEYIREHNKQYRENSKEYIACECGCRLTTSCLARHKRSDKHKELMNEIS